jgi:multiple sugar transport system substrate-binding protein/putative aldouronate transport system substrate-binding protein
MKRRLSFLLALVFMFTLAACDDTNVTDGELRNTTGGGGGGDDGLITLTIYSQLANFAGPQTGWAAQIMEEKFGVRIEIVNEAAGTFDRRMETGDLGDIVIFGSDGNQYQRAVEEGMLLDWERDGLLQTHGSFIYEFMQPALEKNRQMEVANGRVYGFGFDVAGTSDDHQAHIYYPYMRWDLYQALGMPPIQTLECFIPILYDMQQLEPFTETGHRTYGVSSFPDWDYDMVMMVKATAALFGWEEFGVGLYNVITQEYQGALEPDGWYLRCLKFYNTLFQLGLFDPDSMTQTFDDAATKYRNGVSFWNIFTFVAETFNSPENLEAGRALMCIPAAEQKNLVEGLNIYGSNRVWTIGSRTARPDLAMQIINWLCTPEGVLTYNYGPQGLTWDYDENGNTFLTEIGIAAQDDKRNTMFTYKGQEQSYEDGEFQHNNTTWSRDAINMDSASGESFNWDFWASTIDNRHVFPIEQSWRDWAGGVTTADEFLRNEGKMALSVGTMFSAARRNNRLNMTWEQVTTSIVDFSWRAIYAPSDEEFNQIVADMIADAKARGYYECIEFMEEQAVLRREAENKVLNR